MEKNKIKDILTNDLAQISSTDFNDKIISELKENRVFKPKPIFKKLDILSATLVSLLLLIIVEYKIIDTLNQTTLMLSVTLSFIPIFFIAFNKIHQLTINQKTK